MEKKTLSCIQVNMVYADIMVVCFVFSQARYTPILSKLTWPVADGQHYLLSGSILFFQMESFQCVGIAESKSISVSALTQ
jgi:hypothetical protein